MLIILATQETELRRIMVRSKPRLIIVLETLFQKNSSQKRDSRVAQTVGPEFKP
jgi:hypothetical protein